MKIRDDRLKEFQDAYKADFGEEITIAEAREMLSRLVTLYELLLRPFPESQIENEVIDSEQNKDQHLQAV